MDHDLYTEQSGKNGVAADTQVITESKQLIRVDCLSSAWNVRTIWQGKIASRPVMFVKKLPERVVISFGTATKRVVVTELLPVLVKEGSAATWVPAMNLKLDDQVMCCDDMGSAVWWEPIIDFGIEEFQPMWNVRVGKPHCAFFNGIMLHS